MLEDMEGQDSKMKLFGGVRKTFSTMLGVMLISVLIAACGNSGGGGGTPPASSGGAAQTGGGKGCTKVGVLLPETASAERWDRNDRPLLTKKIEAIPGVKVDYYDAISMLWVAMQKLLAVPASMW